MTLGEAHELTLALRDTLPRLSRERDALAMMSNAVDEVERLRDRVFVVAGERDVARALLRDFAARHQQWLDTDGAGFDLLVEDVIEPLLTGLAKALR